MITMYKYLRPAGEKRAELGPVDDYYRAPDFTCIRKRLFWRIKSVKKKCASLHCLSLRVLKLLLSDSLCGTLIIR